MSEKTFDKLWDETCREGRMNTTIEFTQYLLPDGRKKPCWILRPARIVAIADELKQRGLSFEIEILTTGEISMTIEDPDDDYGGAIEVVPNGPEVPLAVDRLVLDAKLRFLTTSGPA